jgi:RNA polymerase sigma factor (sigma-70 family)
VERDVASGADTARTGAVQFGALDFGMVYRQQSLWAARVAFLLTSDANLAEDLVQEAFLALYRHADQVENPRAYLRVTLANLATRNRRREGRRTKAHVITAKRETVDANANELFDVIGRLPPKQRVVIVLRYYEGLSEAEIAAALRCAPGTVKSLASRAIDRLRKEVFR